MNNKIALITNIPAPYRETIHRLVSAHFSGNYTVIYCQQKEPNRQWQLDRHDYHSVTLGGRMVSYKGRFIHINPEVITQLNKLDPGVIITTGFNPTMLLAFAWSLAKGRKHIAMTDGWLKSEAGLSHLHRLVRQLVYWFSAAYLGASRHSLDLYRHYHCREEALFQSHLCANNEAFFPQIGTPKKHDLLFSGQFIAGKMPLFFAEVAQKIRHSKGSCSALVLGDGPLKEEFLGRLSAYGIEVEYPGFVAQQELPPYYASARILLFPTRQEAWGVVANEAMAAGVPVITCDNAGVANDLVQHNKNGYILPLDADTWCHHALQLLRDPALYQQFSANAVAAVQPFNYANAAQGIIDAITFAQNKK